MSLFASNASICLAKSSQWSPGFRKGLCKIKDEDEDSGEKKEVEDCEEKFEEIQKIKGEVIFSSTQSLYRTLTKAKFQ